MKHSVALKITVIGLCYMAAPSMAISGGHKCVNLTALKLTPNFWSLERLLGGTSEKFRVECDGEEVGSIEAMPLECMVPEEAPTEYLSEKVDDLEVRSFSPEYSPETTFFETFDGKINSGWGYISKVPSESTLSSALVSRYCSLSSGVSVRYSSLLSVDVSSAAFIRLLIKIDTGK